MNIAEQSISTTTVYDSRNVYVLIQCFCASMYCMFIPFSNTFYKCHKVYYNPNICFVEKSCAWVFVLNMCMYMYMYQKIVIYQTIVMLTMFKDLIKNEQ